METSPTTAGIRRVMTKLFPLFVALLLLPSCANRQEARWKTVDEGFLISVPSEWRKKKVEGIDSVVGQYRGEGMDLSYDWVSGLNYTFEDSAEAAEMLRKFAAAPDTLPRGEQVWDLDGRLVRYRGGDLPSTPKGDEKYRKFAEIFVPFEGEGSYLSVRVLYRDEGDVVIARHMLKSIRWKN